MIISRTEAQSYLPLNGHLVTRTNWAQIAPCCFRRPDVLIPQLPFLLLDPFLCNPMFLGHLYFKFLYFWLLLQICLVLALLMSFVVAVLMFSWPAALAAASEAHIVKQFSLPRNLSNSLSELHIERHCPSAYMWHSAAEPDLKYLFLCDVLRQLTNRVLMGLKSSPKLVFWVALKRL